MERTADFDITADELWEVIGDPEGLASWLGDEVDLDVSPGSSGRIVDDGEVREVEVDEVVPGQRLAFRWWPEHRRQEASEVEIVVVPLRRGSRIAITERPQPMRSSCTLLAA